MRVCVRMVGAVMRADEITKRDAQKKRRGPWTEPQGKSTFRKLKVRKKIDSNLVWDRIFCVM